MAPSSAGLYTLSLHDALPIWVSSSSSRSMPWGASRNTPWRWNMNATLPVVPRLPLWALKWRSEEHTSELQSLRQLVCRLLLEKKKHRHHAPRYEDLIEAYDRR